ncbi:tetratricopeptide repeat protein [Methylovulum miyakonense]|uniref:tetratricopeptide repeat protein n=1 Tax=Methylovulum miyakonense TaxID=645578 RepID=UPI000378BD08|nr:tetratricopeptide repeat protein [Methylovulum miyakonense]
MKPDNLHKKERLFNKAVKKAEERNDKGFFEGAALAYLEAAKLFSEKEHPELVAVCFNDAGLVYTEAKKYIQAEKCLKRALAIREKKLGKDNLDTAKTLSSLGVVFSEKREFDIAEEYYQRVLEIRLNALEENHPDIVGAYNNLGSLYGEKGEFDKAKKYYELGSVDVCRIG